MYRLHVENVIEIRHYVNRGGKDGFDDWLTQLADARSQAKIASRINRLAAGNFGHQPDFSFFRTQNYVFGTLKFTGIRI